MSEDRTKSGVDPNAEREVDLRSGWARITARWWLPVGGLFLGAILGVLVSIGSGDVFKAEALIYLGQPFTPGGGGQIQNLQTNPKTVSEIIRSEAATRAAAASRRHEPGRAARQRHIDSGRPGGTGRAQLHPARPDRGPRADQGQGGEGRRLVREHRDHRGRAVRRPEDTAPKAADREQREPAPGHRCADRLRARAATGGERRSDPLARGKAARLDELERDRERGGVAPRVDGRRPERCPPAARARRERRALPGRPAGRRRPGIRHEPAQRRGDRRPRGAGARCDCRR